MTAGLAEAKVEYEEQTFDLFEDLDAPPMLLRSAADYVMQLAGVSFHDRDQDDQPWTLWALAPKDQRWSAWAAAAARDRDPDWLYGLEHVWLTRDGALRKALVEIHTGLILQTPDHRRAAEPQEGQP